MYINQSLSYLEQCVVALSRRNAGHVPYRQSKLTNVLKVKRSATATEHTRPAVPPARETSLSGKGRNIEESKSGGGARVRTRCTAVGGKLDGGSMWRVIFRLFEDLPDPWGAKCFFLSPLVSGRVRTGIYVFVETVSSAPLAVCPVAATPLARIPWEATATPFCWRAYGASPSTWRRRCRPFDSPAA